MHLLFCDINEPMMRKVVKLLLGAALVLMSAQGAFAQRWSVEGGYAWEHNYVEGFVDPVSNGFYLGANYDFFSDKTVSLETGLHFIEYDIRLRDFFGGIFHDMVFFADIPLLAKIHFPLGYGLSASAFVGPDVMYKAIVFEENAGSWKRLAHSGTFEERLAFSALAGIGLTVDDKWGISFRARHCCANPIDGFKLLKYNNEFLYTLGLSWMF